MPKPSDEEIRRRSSSIAISVDHPHPLTIREMAEIIEPQLIAIRDATWNAALDEAAVMVDLSEKSDDWISRYALACAIRALREKP